MTIAPEETRNQHQPGSEWLDEPSFRDSECMELSYMGALNRFREVEKDLRDDPCAEPTVDFMNSVIQEMEPYVKRGVVSMNDLFLLIDSTGDLCHYSKTGEQVHLLSCRKHLAAIDLM